MKTDQLIDSLVADQDRKPLRAGHGILYALPPAIILSMMIFAYFLDMRPDLADALATWRYLLKVLMAALIAVTATVFVLHLANPLHAPRAAFRFLPLLALPLLAGFAAEGSLLAREQWATAALGQQPYFCLIFVPLLSLAPLVATLWAIGRGAPQSPLAGGAAAGLAAGGIGALIFAIHCDNDSPFYVAIWYLGAIAIVTLLGALIGRRYLRW
ncbi:NrsF family protein [Dongia sp.]|uniref:NrsF family protein n=1 Tax=Dongia sp. TaxID=1977262 RepID=UPI0035AF90D9